ncbi:MAG: alpha/beta hydrolase [Porphyrobacter sp.]|nr:alpha/beta hydrolase [Porphyrobacter sp.]
MPSRVVQYPAGVMALADVEFSRIEGFRPLILDVYLPADRIEPKPLIVYVHGGGWRGGHTRQSGAFADFPAVLAELASRGYVVASVEYRLSGEAPFPAALDDVRTAIRFLKANARSYGIDTSRTGIFGGSAGGQLAILEALACGASPTGADKANPEFSDCPQAAVGWYGIYDFPAMPQNSGQRAEYDYLGCEPGRCSPTQLDAASAIAHADANDPPILLLHGRDDRVVPVAQSETMAEKLKAVGASVELDVISGVGHSWIGASDTETREASLRALDQTYRFFDKHLRSRE